MKRVDRVTGVVLLVLGLIMAEESLRLGLTRSGILGPGVFPLLSSSGVALLSLLLIWNSRGTGGRPAPKLPSGDEFKSIGAFAISLVLYVAVTETVGFFLTTMLFVGGLMYYPGRYGWKPIVAVSIPLTVVLYVGLGRYLGVALPPGILAQVGL